MNFKYSAFVKIADSQKRKEVIEFLEGLGYELDYNCNKSGTVIIKTYEKCIYNILYPSNYKDGVTFDCGENIELFEAIAAINDENDFMQWFVSFDYGEDWMLSFQERLYINNTDWRKATPEQLIEYFKDKE